MAPSIPEAIYYESNKHHNIFICKLIVNNHSLPTAPAIRSPSLRLFPFFATSKISFRFGLRGAVAIQLAPWLEQLLVLIVNSL